MADIHRDAAITIWAADESHGDISFLGLKKHMESSEPRVALSNAHLVTDFDVILNVSASRSAEPPAFDNHKNLTQPNSLVQSSTATSWDRIARVRH